MFTARNLSPYFNSAKGMFAHSIDCYIMILKVYLGGPK